MCRGPCCPGWPQAFEVHLCEWRHCLQGNCRRTLLSAKEQEIVECSRADRLPGKIVEALLCLCLVNTLSFSKCVSSSLAKKGPHSKGDPLHCWRE